ncbi:conserved membrane hypothetical protein [Hyella patelloides LEGE 07179]|uniref:ZIP Zinc transporter n=1 Tax=Hyella patelloides LEGE 07179 TaxID=945734 RepID=A0A563VXM2_9CYAN|nr:hypothetical protein [Hyella patelloides]VEP16160.1 conserved membrane hypothetical protein [Hyella patelloides LEGE 07179]
MASQGLILAVALGLVHGFANKLPIFSIIPRFRWTSFAGGVSLSYVFLEIFPELSHAQEELQHSEIFLIQYLENHVYILALLGLLLFYGLDVLALRAKSHQQATSETEQHNSAIFWIHLSGFAIFNVILGYLLQNLSEHSLIACILFFISVALHFFIIDENLREHQQSLYDKLGRWLLVSAIIFGAVIGQIAHVNEAAISIIWSFLAGSIILNVLKRELPDEKENCFGSFISGAFLFAVLVLSM